MLYSTLQNVLLNECFTENVKTSHDFTDITTYLRFAPAAKLSRHFLFKVFLSTYCCMSVFHKFFKTYMVHIVQVQVVSTLAHSLTLSTCTRKSSQFSNNAKTEILNDLQRNSRSLQFQNYKKATCIQTAICNIQKLHRAEIKQNMAFHFHFSSVWFLTKWNFQMFSWQMNMQTSDIFQIKCFPVIYKKNPVLFKKKTKFKCFFPNWTPGFLLVQSQLVGNLSISTDWCFKNR